MRDYKEYILKQDAITLTYIAAKMWPSNKNSRSYLSTKLNDADPKRPWTDADNVKAKEVIRELGEQLLKDTE